MLTLATSIKRKLFSGQFFSFGCRGGGEGRGKTLFRTYCPSPLEGGVWKIS